MTAGKPITIIGGGLAGLMLGILLRRCGVGVAILEAGRYPRHRVCGEFISGRGVMLLKAHGLLDDCLAAGAGWARKTAFFAPKKRVQTIQLPEPALCLSRFELDALLSRRFEDLNGTLVQGHRFMGTPVPEGHVIATGRRRSTPETEPRWIGLKAHVRQVDLFADLEMHFLENAYIGLCRLTDGNVNACGLFRVGRGQDTVRPELWLRGPDATVLRDRMQRAEVVPGTLCSVAGLDLKPQRAVDKPEIRLGDALTMIPPLTGNGMSLALESAVLAAGPLERYSHGDCSWPEARHEIGCRLDETFARRLRWASGMQRLLFSRWGRPLLLGMAGRSGRSIRRWFHYTR